MQPAIRRPGAVTTLALALALAAGSCGGSATPTPSAAASPTPPSATPSQVPSDGPVTPTPTERPTPTAVPGGGTPTPLPPPSTTETEWGMILDAVPAAFPRYPGAEDAEADEPVSEALVAAAPAGDVGDWYAAALEAVGISVVDRTGPFEDGSIVLDAMGGLPECLMQLRFRPVGESTMITVLYGAGCAGLTG